MKKTPGQCMAGWIVLILFQVREWKIATSKFVMMDE